ncbi:universal stress protein [Streptomyces collinus]|uniref:universal stress protein n=1 Tax=Streptomyces TaxID=1883 RepID=UPI003440A270
MGRPRGSWWASTAPNPRAQLCGGRWPRHGRQNAAVEAVTGWTIPATSSFVPVPASDLEAAARQALAHAVDQERHTAPEVPLDTHIVHGHPAQILVDTANGADLLVVGSRGLGGFTGTLLGSVSRYCVEHATCPVVVMRDNET